MAETIKAQRRRSNEDWFEQYAPFYKSGIDLGCGNDCLNQSFRRFDAKFGDGDAQFMHGTYDDQYYTVYASHLLEHLENPIEAIYNWYRICRSPGHVIICVPHRDLYEKKLELPSRWNEEHKTFWLPEKGELPATRGLREVILQAIPHADIVSLRILNDGWASNGDAHSSGEYSIEAIIRK